MAFSNSGIKPYEMMHENSVLNKKNLVGYPNDALNSGLDSARAMRVKVSAICAEFAQNISINFIFRQ